MVERVAVYYAPAVESELWRIGNAWLGRDAYTGELFPNPPVPLDIERWLKVIAPPRLYGLHATLKPPFQLRPGFSLADFQARLAEFAIGQRPLNASSLILSSLNGFLALIPSLPSHDLDNLAAACVQELDGFRQPLDKAELDRRKQKILSPRQLQLLERWGYPYLFDEFRFHITLTGSLAADERRDVFNVIQSLFEPIYRQPFRVTDICLFVQDQRNQPFYLLERYPLGMR
jgi:putative phosphonate metabolism protein